MPVPRPSVQQGGVQLVGWVRRAAAKEQGQGCGKGEAGSGAVIGGCAALCLWVKPQQAAESCQ